MHNYHIRESLNMVSPLRKLRKSKKMTLSDLQKKLSEVNECKTISHLSLVERGLVWPSKELVDSLVEVFQGQLTEIQILYPLRDHLEEK